MPRTIGDRRIHIEGFAADAILFVRPHHTDGSHIVQPVGELDQDHADILDHRQ